MTIAEHVYRISQELPSNMLLELLDFAEFLEQKKNKYASQEKNLAKTIHQRFSNLYFDDVTLPQRSIIRNPLDFN